MVNTREIAEEYRLSHWAKIMHERIESGLTIKAFCRRVGMCTNTYFYWQRRLREAACQALPAVKQNSNEKGAIPNGLVEQSVACLPATPPGWAVCNVADTDTKESPVTIVIGKGKITVDADFNSELLAKVCRVLTSLC